MNGCLIFDNRGEILNGISFKGFLVAGALKIQ